MSDVESGNSRAYTGGFGQGLPPREVPVPGSRRGSPGGGSVPVVGPSGGGNGGRQGTAAEEDVRSVVEDDVDSGGGNVSGGVARRRKRVLRGLVAANAHAAVSRNYLVAGGVQFNNIQELYQDMVSYDEAQEILERVFQTWGLPFDEPRTMKFAEDLVSGFIVAVSASDKADWSVAFDVPAAKGEIEADFKKFSDILMREYGVTRRQLARGLANRTRAYLMAQGNQHMLADIATKVGCDTSMAPLAFDGSTHCSGMNPREIQFTKTLENRNLFEREDEIAVGASTRLMAGLSTGPRAVR